MNFNNFFNIEVFSLIENSSYSNFTLGRGRIFYKGINRNATYISEEFAEKLLSTAPYSPLKGIFEEDVEDFMGHSKDEEDKKKEIVYGIIPAEPNIHLEKQLDKDGVERDYYCVDILLFSGVYGEEKISTIIGKKLSMEIIPESIKVIDRFVNGKVYKEFTDGNLRGLQILGDRIEPCFEGAGVDKYSLDTIKEIYELLKKEEKTKMKKTIEFEYTNEQEEIANKIAEYNENYLYVPNGDQNIAWVYDKNSFLGFEEKDDSYNFFDFKTEKEYNELEEKYEKLEAEKVELEEKYSLLEKESEKNEETVSKEDYEILKTEKEELEEKYSLLIKEKETEENSKKEELISGFEKVLGEKINPFKEKISEYSLEELDKELTYLMVKETNQSNFSYNYQGLGQMKDNEEENNNKEDYSDLLQTYLKNKKGGK